MSKSRGGLKGKKFIFVTGGVVSGLGKGTLSSSINLIMQDLGIKSLMQKADPYINFNAGLLSPEEHGEVFVCKDGTEADLDLGHYMRMTESPLSKLSSFTAGQIYKEIIDNETSAKYGGKTVQIVPHFTDAIINRILDYIKGYPSYDAIIVEIGGTVGDIESAPFLESIRQLKLRDPDNVFSIHLSYVPKMQTTGEWKTKPTQHSIITLRSLGIAPDVIVCRTDDDLPEWILKKISTMCSVPEENVISMISCDSIYRVPLMLNKKGMRSVLRRLFNVKSIGKIGRTLKKISGILKQSKDRKYKAKICIISKYGVSKESYKSLYESLEHAGIHLNCEVEVVSIPVSAFSEEIDNIKDLVSEFNAVIIPGGFGKRGWLVKKKVALYCYENNIPCLGICFGLQVLICALLDKYIDHPEKKTYTSQEILEEEAEGAKDAEEAKRILSSGEFAIKLKDGNMMLGECGINILQGSSYSKIIGSNTYNKEIFRHRYIIDNRLAEELEKRGIITISGIREGERSIDVIEVNDQDWCFGVQFHPELKSTLINARSIFLSLIAQCQKKI